jgi:DNA-binding transcriptional ArsR family regulator
VIPAPPLPREGLSRGTNQIGVRLYNERLILSLIRRLQRVPKAEIARRTGLSAQTVSVIMRQLEADGLVLKRDPQRGRVGQPSVPFQLDPDGAFGLGLKIGRRSSDLVLIDFAGALRGETRLTHPYPTPRALLDFVGQGLPRP